MIVYVAALIGGLLRLPAWTLLAFLAAQVAWAFYVDLAQLNAFRASLGEPPIGFEDEAALIGLGISLFITIVAYIVGRAIRQGVDKAKAPPP